MARGTRGAAQVALLLGAVAVAMPGRARADETDACIAAAEHAQVERKAGRLREARDGFVVCARDACPALVRRDCARWLAEAEAATPSIVLRVTDAAGDVTSGARVTVDGRPSDEALEGRALDLDPGPHEVRVERAGAAAVVRSVVLREGERGRVVSVALDGGVAVRAASAPRSTSVTPWILGGSSVALLAAGGALWGVGLSSRSDLYATCGVARTCTQGQIDGSRGDLIAGDVLFGVGLLAGGGLVVWALTSRGPSSSHAARAVPHGVEIAF
jgi:hypothetical protein